MWVQIMLALSAMVFLWLRKRSPSPLWTGVLVAHLVLLIIVSLTSRREPDVSAQYLPIFESCGAALGRMVIESVPESGTVLLLMHGVIPATESKVKGLRKTLDTHRFRLAPPIILPVWGEDRSYDWSDFEQAVQSGDYVAVVSLHGLPPAQAGLNLSAWPPMFVYAPDGGVDLPGWKATGKLKGAVIPNPDFIPQPLDRMSAEVLFDLHYRVY